jgi:hypothetical protein
MTRRLEGASSELNTRIFKYNHNICAEKDTFEYNITMRRGVDSSNTLQAFIAYPVNANFNISQIYDVDSTFTFPPEPSIARTTSTDGTQLIYKSVTYKVQRIVTSSANLAQQKFKINAC